MYVKRASAPPQEAAQLHIATGSNLLHIGHNISATGLSGRDSLKVVGVASLGIHAMSPRYCYLRSDVHETLGPHPLGLTSNWSLSLPSFPHQLNNGHQSMSG